MERNSEWTSCPVCSTFYCSDKEEQIKKHFNSLRHKTCMEKSLCGIERSYKLEGALFRFREIMKTATGTFVFAIAGVPNLDKVTFNLSELQELSLMHPDFYQAGHILYGVADDMEDWRMPKDFPKKFEAALSSDKIKADTIGDRLDVLEKELNDILSLITDIISDDQETEEEEMIEFSEVARLLNDYKNRIGWILKAAKETDLSGVISLCEHIKRLLTSDIAHFEDKK